MVPFAMPFRTTLIALLAVFSSSAICAELIGDTVISGRPQVVIPPEYPADALANKVTGKLVVELEIDNQGFTTGYKMLQSEPAGQFDAAFAAVAKWWVYYPLIEDCKPVAGKVVNSLTFDLPDGKPSVVVEVEADWKVDNAPQPRPEGSIYLKKPAGKYPDEALRNGQQGFVLARFERDETEKLVAPKIAFARPAKVFDRAVLSALGVAKLKPLAPGSTEDKVVCQLFVFTIQSM